MKKRKAGLKIGARLTLFLVSYMPLFVIMVFGQFYKYSNYLNWGGFNWDSLFIFIKYFGAATVLIILSIYGAIGLKVLLTNIERRAKTNGNLVKIDDIENKNSESISYLFTYIIPFVFQDLSSVINVFSVTMLLVVTFLIYSNSSMLLINPTISMKYSLYMIEYTDSDEGKKKKGMIISRNKFLEEDDQVKIKKIGHRLFFAVDIGGNDAS
ncbi:TPA: hypothetical protein ACOJPH_004867 [Vibrio campbellii]|uniref:hypothetical protein n=1 Tax=Vibrio campbellii TaxID=680 RepID=UPI0028E0E695|nr:hypothetical protein [Vibrio vulnificus]